MKYGGWPLRTCYSVDWLAADRQLLGRVKLLLAPDSE